MLCWFYSWLELTSWVRSRTTFFFFYKQNLISERTGYWRQSSEPGSRCFWYFPVNVEQRTPRCLRQKQWARFVANKRRQSIHVCATMGAWTCFFDLSCLVSTDVFLFVKRRSPFAGVVRTCYPLSMAFDGRLTEKSLIVLLLCYVGKVGCS